MEVQFLCEIIRIKCVHPFISEQNLDDVHVYANEKSKEITTGCKGFCNV